MVNEVKPKFEKSDSLDFALRRIKAVVEAMPEIEAQTLEPALKNLKRVFNSSSITVPSPDPKPKQDSPLKYAFKRPCKVQVIGSWILQTAALRPEGVDVDLVLTMPSSLFQEKDYLNMRYFHKRAYYLAAIAAALQGEKELGVQCQYATVEEDVLRPYLRLQFSETSSQINLAKVKAYVKIHLAHEVDLFPVRRLSPSRNNIRIDKTEEFEQPATPCYNASILADSLFSSHLIYLNATKELCPSFAEACILLKTWSFQRAFGSGLSKAQIKGKINAEKGRRIAFGSNSIRFILSMLLAYLLQGPEKTVESSIKIKLSPGFSSYQLFRGAIDFLASHDFSTEPVIMKAMDGIVSNRDKIDVEEFSKHASAVLVDPTGSINLLQNMQEGSLKYLQSEARATMELLNDTDEDHFEQVFLQDRSKPSFAFDQLVRIDLGRVKGDSRIIADLGSNLCATVAETFKTLHHALNTRASLITFFRSSQSVVQWSLEEFRKKQSNQVEIGIMYDSQQAFRLVDHGPRPEDQIGSEAFKSFWGDVAELRRFRDGRIVESVVWSISGPMDRPTIPQSIIKHVLERHHHIPGDRITFHSEAFQGLLLPNDRLARDVYLSMPSEGGFQTIQGAFDNLVKSLRNLEGLPLSLISVVGSDPGLRSMSVMVPSPVNLNTTLPISSPYIPMHDFVMTLESSGKWPDDLVAIQAMKMAFYEAMAIKLVESNPSCKTAIVLDVDAKDNRYWDCSALEIILSSGLAFRGRIHHERERLLLHRLIDDKDEEAYNRTAAKSALDRFETRFEHNERHHNHMAALSHRFTSLGEAVRLFKRWISSQLLGMDVPEQLCELVVASVYIKSSESNRVPSMGHTGFLQALRVLSEWNWRQEPLRVAMLGSTSSTPLTSLTTEAKRSVEVNFEQIRKSDPGLNHFAWFIATENELTGVNWARKYPSSGTADALQRLARGAYDVLSAGSYLNAGMVKSLFLPSSSHFDFVIHLEPSVVNRYLDYIAFDEDLLEQSLCRVTQGKAEAKSKYRNFSLPSFSTVQSGLNIGKEFVELLDSLFLDTMRLYYDPIGGIIIGGLFNPSLNKARPFRVGLGFNSKPVDDKSKDVILNQKAVLAEVERLGKGIIERIEWRRR